MIDAIDNAERQILIETYIWKGDATGRRFRDALNAAAARGVEVYVIYDGFANLVVRPSFYTFHPDVHVFRFPVLRPVGAFHQHPGHGLDHRKLMVVDNAIGFRRRLQHRFPVRDQVARHTPGAHGPSVWELRQAS
jgi:cardiolipin synthase